jgi:hypothetical protein
LVSFCGNIAIDSYFSQHSPREPKPDEGRVHLVVSNKVRVYLTRQELVALYLPGYSFIVWLAAMLYFGVRWKFMRVAVREPGSGVPIVPKKKGDAG